MTKPAAPLAADEGLDFLTNVPEDDEPTTDENLRAHIEGMRDIRRGETIDLKQIPVRPLSPLAE